MGGGGMASMMDEMQKTLARRRAKVDRSSEEPDSDKQDEKSSSPGKPFSQPGSQAGSESPKPGNRRRHSTRGSYCGQDTTDLVTTDSCGHSAGEVSMNGNSSELEAMKQEILQEVRKEINKAK